MFEVSLYGLKNCSTCIKARKWLVAQGLECHFIDYRDTPVDPGSLTTWADSIGWDKLVNRSSVAWRNLPEDKKTPTSTQHWLDLIAAFPTLIRRPVAVGRDGQVLVGFSESTYNAHFVPSTGDSSVHDHSDPA